MLSRKIEDLLPEAQEAYKRFESACRGANVKFIVTSTYRSQDEQDKLFAQGRTAPGKIVTWTRHSKHTDRIAWDIAIVKDEKACWDVKVDIDQDSIPDYLEAADIAEDLGITAGAFWHTPDYCHFEVLV